jgi:hypothetical protein
LSVSRWSIICIWSLHDNLQIIQRAIVSCWCCELTTMQIYMNIKTSPCEGACHIYIWIKKLTHRKKIVWMLNVNKKNLTFNHMWIIRLKIEKYYILQSILQTNDMNARTRGSRVPYVSTDMLLVFRKTSSRYIRYFWRKIRLTRQLSRVSYFWRIIRLTHHLSRVCFFLLP